MLGEIVELRLTCAKDRQKAEGCVMFERGFATIYLLCFDVPPRSRYLWAGVKLF